MDNFWIMGIAQYGGNMDKGSHILLGRWGVHHDEGRAITRVNTEIAAKTGVRRGGPERIRLELPSRDSI